MANELNKNSVKNSVILKKKPRPRLKPQNSVLTEAEAEGSVEFCTTQRT